MLRHGIGNDSEEITNFCPATSDARCEPCLKINQKEPTPDEFMKYLPWFLKDNPGIACNKGFVISMRLENQVIEINTFQFLQRSCCLR